MYDPFMTRNDITIEPMIPIRLKRSQKHMNTASMESFLRTIPNGKPVHVSIQNVAVRLDAMSQTPDNLPIANGDIVLAPAILYIYSNGRSQLCLPGTAGQWLA